MPEEGFSLADAQTEAFGRDLVEGLSARPKTLPSRWLYDDRGSELFEKITGLAEYYPTRTERAILEANAGSIARFFGARAVLIEYGAGASIKTEIVLDALVDPALYVPVDIAGDFLHLAAARVRERFPGLAVEPVVADFTADFALPDTVPEAGRGAFFPGSTIGNLNREEAVALLRRMRGHIGAGGAAVIGADLKKDVEVLKRAYDDEAGVTAEFDRNILRRAQRELGAVVPMDAFRHEARWNEKASAIEMHLVAERACEIVLGEHQFVFEAGETIHTESSRKYDLDTLGQLAREGGFELTERWQDPEGLFAVVGLRAR